MFHLWWMNLQKLDVDSLDWWENKDHYWNEIVSTGGI